MSGDNNKNKRNSGTPKKSENMPDVTGRMDRFGGLTDFDNIQMMKNYANLAHTPEEKADQPTKPTRRGAITPDSGHEEDAERATKAEAERNNEKAASRAAAKAARDNAHDDEDLGIKELFDQAEATPKTSLERRDAMYIKPKDRSKDAAEALNSSSRRNSQQGIEMQDLANQATGSKRRGGITPDSGHKDATAQATREAETGKRDKKIAEFITASTPEQAIDKICSALEERMVVQNAPKAGKDMISKANVDNVFKPFRDRVREQLQGLDENQKIQLLRIVNNPKEFDKTINNMVLGLQSVATVENTVSDAERKTEVTYNKPDTKINGMEARKEAIREQLKASLKDKEPNKVEVGLRAAMWSVADFVVAAFHKLTGKPEYMTNYLSNKHVVITDVDTLQKSFDKSPINVKDLQNIMDKNAKQQETFEKEAKENSDKLKASAAAKQQQEGRKVGNSTFYTQETDRKRSDSNATLHNPEADKKHDYMQYSRTDSQATLVPIEKPQDNKRTSSASTLWEKPSEDNKRTSTATVRLSKSGPEVNTDYTKDSHSDNPAFNPNDDHTLKPEQVKRIDSAKELNSKYKAVDLNLEFPKASEAKPKNLWQQLSSAVSSMVSRGPRQQRSGSISL